MGAIVRPIRDGSETQKVDKISRVYSSAGLVFGPCLRAASRCQYVGGDLSFLLASSRMTSYNDFDIKYTRRWVKTQFSVKKQTNRRTKTA